MRPGPTMLILQIRDALRRQCSSRFPKSTANSTTITPSPPDREFIESMIKPME